MEELKRKPVTCDGFAVKNFDRKSISHKTRYLPKAFTERGLYMLATILKSPRATQTTLAIIDTFGEARAMARTTESLQTVSDGDGRVAFP